MSAATLAGLLHESAFGLRVAVPPSTSDVLTARVTWAHSSDLADPTPWLEPGQLLLTDGAQFRDTDLDADAYVRRLVEAEVLALGFAVGVLHDVLPPELATRCREHGLPLFEVPSRTPFIGLVRWVADAQATETRQQLEWSLQAHRSLARAALQADGLVSVLKELERQLGGWVALYDAAGEPVITTSTHPVPAAALPAVTDAVRRVLARGTRASFRTGAADTEITVQTLGQRHRLRGALVVGTPTRLDPTGTDLVASVIALASIALDQTRRLDQARRRLRAGLWELLLSGDSAVAHRTAQQLWGPLPREPLQVVQAATPVSDLVVAALEQHVAGRPSQVFFAERGGQLQLVVTANRLDAVLEQLSRAGVTAAGVSAPVGWHDLVRGVGEAERAAAHATDPERIVRFAELADEGLLCLLEVSGGREVAYRLLGPLLRMPPAEQETLMTTVRVWTQHNCAWDPAAKQLGIHRHTVRSRVDQVGQLLGLDLSRFPARAELWTAIALLES